jgi:sulfane dehydrogenase subunit SoxC
VSLAAEPPRGAIPAAGIDPAVDAGISRDELQLAARNHGLPLEALRYDVTPTGLHYLLVHYDVPDVDPAAWRLRLDGCVRTPLELSLDALMARPAVTRAVTMECAGNGRARLVPRPVSQPWLHEAVGTGEWTGTPLAPLLHEAGIEDRADEVVFTGLDRGVEGGAVQSYARSLPLSEALADHVLLVYALNGRPLPPQHGFPLRLLVPGWYGMASVKWLAAVTAVSEPFTGFQQARSYRLRQAEDETGVPVTRIAVRSLMVPPGIPDFLTRRRFVESGPCELTGRAWSGHGRIERVEVSDDGGRTWHEADLDEPVGRHAWQRWRFVWEPSVPGAYELCCRATDAAGHTQPLQPAWNLGGYAVNDVHRVPVTVGTHPGFTPSAG